MYSEMWNMYRPTLEQGWAQLTSVPGWHNVNAVFLMYVVVSTLLSLEGGESHLGKAQPSQEQRYPFLSVCVGFLCVQTMVWLPAFGILNVHTGVDACNCTQGLYRCRKRVCTESRLWDKRSCATPSTQTHASTAPGFSVRHSTNWAICTQRSLQS